VANYDSVATPEGGERIVRAALDTWGRIDVLVNNAGILRDKSLAKMEPETWQAVLSVHLDGAYHVSRPAFAAMRAAGRGRIVMTTSAAGLYGNFGQTNYAAAKMGVVGLMNTLRIEGEKYGLRVNAVAPLAASRLTEDVMPPDIFARLEPEFVVPLVVYLCSEDCAVSGQVFNAGGGVFSRAAVLTGAGARLGDADRPPTVEQVQACWGSIRSLDQGREFTSALEAILDLTQPPEAAAHRQDETGGAESEPSEVAAVFERMPDAFRPQAAAGVEAVFQYHVGGTEGGDWYCKISEGACTVAAGRHAAPTCSLHMAAGDFVDMIAGRLPAMQAYTSGKLRIEGDILKSQLIEKLFDLKAARQG
jgi:putative sterol carrier protein